MKFKLFLILLIGIPALLFSGNSFEDCGWENCACKKNLYSLRARLQAAKVGKPPGNGRQYARDRIVDVLHQKIDFTPHFENRSLRGTATTSFAPIAKPLEKLDLDAFDLTIESVESTHKIESWDYDDKRISILFEKAIPAGEQASVTVQYSAEPEDGLFFRTEAMGYPAGDDHLWTQGEPEKHRHWFPGYDFPNERFTSEVICHVPESMIVLSNGTLISDEVTDGIRTTHWHQKKPHVNYLISVIAGHFQKLEATHGEVPLAFYTTPSEFAVAENSFRDTAKILTFLGKEIGVPYPWAKYYNVCVADFIAGGMENTSISTLTNGTLFSDTSENLRTTHRLDAHEATHQWFGDLLTCKDWSNLWLNEGFATYYTHLYDGHKTGRDEMLYGLFKDGESVTRRKDDKPIVWRGFTDPWEQFDFRAYPKGSWVLHMLRSQLGADLYRECVKTYVERHRFSNVETDDLKDVFEELSGRSFDEFFDQWVFHGGTPQLDVKYDWDAKTKKAKLTVKQTQKVTEKVLLFDFPLPVRFIDAKGKVYDRVLSIQRQTEDFSFALPAKPAIVRIDPELTVLAATKFDPPSELLFNQLENEQDMIGRLLGVRSLRKQKNKKSGDLLKKHLNNDPFHGVRIEAARTLAEHRTSGALVILKSSLNQKDARVRIEVVRAIGKFYSPESLEILQGISANEKNPEIVAAALGAIGKYPTGEVKDMLIAALERDSYRHRIANSAITAMRDQGDPVYVAPLRKHLAENQSRFSRRSLGSAFETLAYLSRDADDPVRDDVREYLASQLNHPNPEFRPAVIRAMGSLEDRRALPILQPYSTAGDADDPVVKAAGDAIKKISATGKQADEVRDLRELVTRLQREVEQLSAKQKNGSKPK
ncbi:MAG: DUF3458 domain-containing protein [Verrucomicrobiales bacterium]|nr:DUF3458 domain-containing protein [Verrucomicrobiales bacterium]